MASVKAPIVAELVALVGMAPVGATIEGAELTVSQPLLMANIGLETFSQSPAPRAAISLLT